MYILYFPEEPIPSTLRDDIGWQSGELGVARSNHYLGHRRWYGNPKRFEGALSDGGFESAIASSGKEAVTLLKGGQTRYAVLVTDINLRGKMDGWEVAKQAREVIPAFPIIYMTGAAADQWASHGIPNSILLTKPFAPAQLVTAVSQLLNTNPPGQ
jgi:CheY-like chemotaxis protein